MSTLFQKSTPEWGSPLSGQSGWTQYGEGRSGFWWGQFDPHIGLSPCSSGLSPVSTFPFKMLLLPLSQKLGQPPVQDCPHFLDSCKCDWDSRSSVVKQSAKFLFQRPSLSSYLSHCLEPSDLPPPPLWLVVDIWGVGVHFSVRLSQTLSQGRPTQNAI